MWRIPLCGLARSSFGISAFRPVSIPHNFGDNVFAKVDLEMKAKALVKCEIKDGKPKKPWRKNPGLMEFLRTL